MSMNEVDILFSWFCGEDEAEYEALKEQAASGNEEVKIELSALNVEKAENVNENMTFLGNMPKRIVLPQIFILERFLAKELQQTMTVRIRLLLLKTGKNQIFILKKRLNLEVCVHILFGDYMLIFIVVVSINMMKKMNLK